ncbi:hypothetical protein Hore_06420 [Halothermothrix orenii H 168]|uniref:Uncharacterized protein n=2 Tax=Halothermothrix orenii TaxID=31909 RepID=B8D2H2_HALOH|nr:hypothetical protein Hore_06420 [Halothermothrix orenii H 168]
MSDLYNWNTTLVPLENMRPGDIIFYTSKEDDVTHGGLFVKWNDCDNFTYIHASAVYKQVITETWTVGEEKWGLKLVAGGRLKKFNKEENY